MNIHIRRGLVAAGVLVPVVAFAAPDPAFAAAMTTIAADVLAYMLAALPIVTGIFGLALAVRFGVGLMRRVAK